MDETGKHFFTEKAVKTRRGYASCRGGLRAGLQVSHPSRLTLGCHLNRWCVVAAPLQRKSVLLKSLTPYNRNQISRQG